MYIMAKTYQNLELLAQDRNTGLSILESRKNNLANLCLAEDYNLRSTPKRMASAAKLVQFQRGLRKSSSLTNGMSPGKNKTALGEYGTEARGLAYSSSMRPSWTSADALSTAPRRRR